MNMLLKKEQVDWKQLNGFWTASEIRQQPETWNKTQKKKRRLWILSRELRIVRITISF